MPLCTVYDETLNEFVTSEECYVDSYDEYSTTCKCDSDGSRRRRFSRNLLSTTNDSDSGSGGSDGSDSPHHDLYYMNGSSVGSVTRPDRPDNARGIGHWRHQAIPPAPSSVVKK